MAGSYEQMVDDTGRFNGNGFMENLGDTFEGFQECYGMIWLLAGGDVARVSDAVLRYREGLMLSPGRTIEADWNWPRDDPRPPARAVFEDG